MWKKEEAEKKAGVRPESSADRERSTPRHSSGERATIGRSITIRGDVTGDEDLVIQGRVEGSVDLKEHSVTVGPEGEVKADVRGRVVTVEGHVEGNLRAEEQVVLRGTARVLGDITAARVTLDDGAYFSGGVEMTETGGQGRAGGSKESVGGGSRQYGGGSTSSGKGEGSSRPEENKSTGTSTAKDTGAAQSTG